MGQKGQLAAVLIGGCIVSPKFIEHAATAGTCMAFKPAIKTKRLVWVSEQFAARFPVCANILSSAISRAGSKWVRVDTVAKLLNLVRADLARPRRQQRRKEAIAIVTPEEKLSKLSHFDNMFVFSEFIKFATSVQHNICKVGVCGA